jgi:hypothetical protein
MILESNESANLAFVEILNMQVIPPISRPQRLVDQIRGVICLNHFSLLRN